MTDDDRRREPPTVGAVLAGIFLILLALTLILAGGGCTVMIGYGLVSQPSPEMLPFLLLSLGVLAAGLGAMWTGVRLISGKRR